MHMVVPRPEPFEPFLQFTPPVRSYSALRAAIRAAYRRPEPDCLEPLLAAATLVSAEREQMCTLARRLVEALRARPSIGLIEGLIQEYSLSTQEGVALMCLAEALLRIPDNAIRDALIADKIGCGDWRSLLGSNRSLFINAATWGLIVTGKLTGASSDIGGGCSVDPRDRTQRRTYHTSRHRHLHAHEGRAVRQEEGNPRAHLNMH